MSLRLATALLVAMVVASSRAFACGGATLLSFQTGDPSWEVDQQGTEEVQGTLSISGGFALLTPLPGDFTFADYQGNFFDSADACVDVLSPTVADPSQAAAGIMFGETEDDFYVFAAEEDGQAAVLQYQNDTNVWLYPVPWRAAPALKKGANVTNSLRVTWKGTTGTAYINGQQFATFTIPAFDGTVFGLWCEGDPDVNPIIGATYRFSNLTLNNVP